ncbi:MAG: DUF1311 domain-containing protein [Rhodothermales bacterium]|nr:DUF1311 domain-containing protein [Rhodothermales bacterium]MBO6780167.1 DUF1311 domain-containing protein [Rhodothermales bacterium]
MRTASALLIALWLVTVGCQTPASDVAPVQSPGPDAGLIPDEYPEAEVLQSSDLRIVVAGHYTSGHEAYVFQPCGVEEAYWVDHDAGLASFHAEVTDEPYEGVFVVVELGLEPPADDGFAADYDGVVSFTRAISQSRRSAADCGAAESTAETPESGTAESDDHPIDRRAEACAEAENWTTTGFMICMDRAGTEWDAELNEQYQLLMSRLEPPEQDALRQAQRNWITFRDAERQLYSEMYGNREGTMWRMVNIELIVGLTRDRAQALARINAEFR